MSSAMAVVTWCHRKNGHKVAIRALSHAEFMKWCIGYMYKQYAVVQY